MEQSDLLRLLLKDRVKLLAYIWSIVRDEHVAEDVYQELSVLALEKHREIRGEGHFLGWLRRAARFKSLKIIQAKEARPLAFSSNLLDLLEDHWKARDTDTAADLVDALQGCLDRLTPYARRIVELRYMQGMSGIRVAELLNRKVRTIYIALSRIHRDLGACVKRQVRFAGRSDG